MHLEIKICAEPECINDNIFFRFIGTTLDGKFYEGWICTNEIGDVNENHT